MSDTESVVCDAGRSPVRIIVIVRTRNEERNIEHFCSSYSWADAILVADGGSTDRTKELASNYFNVRVRDFTETIELENGITRNPHGEHLNFLIDWAKDMQADWIIHDDCDCFPNYLVKQDARHIMEDLDECFIYITRLYLYQDMGHFPKMAQPINRGQYEPSLWAWKASSPFYFAEGRQRSQTFAYAPKKEDIYKMMPPYCLLHMPWQDDAMIERKLNFYRTSEQIKDMQHPLEFGGNLEPLPSWAKE